MSAIFDVVAIPLGFVLGLIYDLIPNYFAAIFLFVLVVRLLLFPLSLKTQKGQADRAKLAPRIEKLQQKYADDPRKLQEKQMALYEKNGVSPTGGCFPMLIQMVVLFGIISVIYSPVKHIARIPDAVINASITAMSNDTEAGITDKEDPKRFTGYYKELRMMQNLEKYKDDVLAEIQTVEEYNTLEKATAVYNEMLAVHDQFNLGNQNMLENPWNDKGFAGVTILWLIPLLSGITAVLSSMLSMHYTKMGAQMQQGQGCTNVMMFGLMPAMSLFIAFTVPGAVGIYWICSNLIALLQTFVLNQIYNPAKIRAQAELEYKERRKRKEEDKKRLAESRAREQRAIEAEKKAEAERLAAEKKKQKAEAARAAAEAQATEPVADNKDEKAE